MFIRNCGLSRHVDSSSELSIFGGFLLFSSQSTVTLSTVIYYLSISSISGDVLFPIRLALKLIEAKRELFIALLFFPCASEESELGVFSNNGRI
jgi:hypothetical protein